MAGIILLLIFIGICYLVLNGKTDITIKNNNKRYEFHSIYGKCKFEIIKGEDENEKKR